MFSMRPMFSCASGLALLALVACGGSGGGGGMSSGGGGGGSSSQMATLRVHVADTPFPFQYVESASVTIKEVRVHETGGDAWTTVFTGSRTIDLVPLHDGVTALLVESQIPAGTYDQVRLIVDAGEVVLTDDAVVQGGNHTFSTEDGRLFFPSGAQTGIKVKIENDIVVTTGLSSDLVLDFDLAKNFVFNGPVTHKPGVKRVLFTPVVRATNESVAGSLRLRAMSDELTPGDTSDDEPIPGATVNVYPDGADPATTPSVATASTGADGVATISLAPGTYEVVVEATGFKPATEGGAVVTLANLTDLGDVTLAKTATISGTVMSDAGTAGSIADDIVVEGATVEVRMSGDTTVVGTATTDASGAFQVAGLDPGAFDVTVSATGFETQTVSGAIPGLFSSPQTILLVALTSVVSGKVSDAGGTGEGGVGVSVTNGAGVVVATTTTAADGTYSVTLGTGTYDFLFTLGAATTTQTLSVVGASPPSATTLDVTL